MMRGRKDYREILTRQIVLPHFQSSTFLTRAGHTPAALYRAATVLEILHALLIFSMPKHVLKLTYSKLKITLRN